MTIDEQVQTHDREIAEIRQALKGLVELQELTQKTVATLIETVGQYVDAAGAKAQENDARMRRIEENLDGLIRAITAEHSNGKGKH